jgi:hypothetical protein
MRSWLATQPLTPAVRTSPKQAAPSGAASSTDPSENSRPVKIMRPTMLGWSKTMRKWLIGEMKQPHSSATRVPVHLSDADRTVDVPLDQIGSVRIEDLAQVREYRITPSEGTTSHDVLFRSGGELRFSLSSTGQVLELVAVDVRASIRPGRVLAIDPTASPDTVEGADRARATLSPSIRPLVN